MTAACVSSVPNSTTSLFGSPALDSLKLALKAASSRHTALAANIGNVNTPGYKRVDLSPAFQASLDQAMGDIREGREAEVGAPSIAPDARAAPARLDGNNVRIDHEMLELMNNSATYELATRLLAKQYGVLRTAITGRVS